MSGLPQEKREKLRLVDGGAGKGSDSGGSGGGGEGQEDKKKLSPADMILLAVKQEDHKLIADQFGRPYIVWRGQPISLSASFDPHLRLLMFDKTKRTIGKDAISQARETLAAHATIEGKTNDLHVRAAFEDGVLYYRLGRGRVWRVDETGHRREDNPPVLFRDIKNLEDLPDPEDGGSFGCLSRWINLKNDRDKRMLVTWLVTVLLPHIPRPMIEATGPEGSGKSTLSRILKRTVDPSKPESIRMDFREFMQKSSHCYVAMLDNERHMPDWASDMLCRLVTGESDSKRELYSDDDDFIYEMKRAIILNGINISLDQGDARDRTLPIELSRIQNYRGEEEIWPDFLSERPKLLGVMFSILSDALRLRSSLARPQRIRLADWASYAQAVYEAMGWGTQKFSDDWDGVKEKQVHGTVDGSPIAQAIISYMTGRQNWEGSSTALHEALENVAESLNLDPKRNKAWPKASNWLWPRINSVLPTLQALGIEAERDRNATGTWIHIRRVPATSSNEARGGPNGAGSIDGSINGSIDINAAIAASEGTEGGWVEGEDHSRDLHLVEPAPDEDGVDIDALMAQADELAEQARRDRDGQ